MYKRYLAQTLHQLHINDIMAVSATDVVDFLFNDEFGLSDNNSDESDEDCIYGYLGTAVLHRPEARVDFPSKDGHGTELA